MHSQQDWALFCFVSRFHSISTSFHNSEYVSLHETLESLKVFSEVDKTVFKVLGKDGGGASWSCVDLVFLGTSLGHVCFI